MKNLLLERARYWTLTIKKPPVHSICAILRKLSIQKVALLKAEVALFYVRSGSEIWQRWYIFLAVISFRLNGKRLLPLRSSSRSTTFRVSGILIPEK